MTDWPKIVRDIMKEEGVTVTRLEIASGVSASTIKRIRRGTTAINLELLETILSSLGYALDAQRIGAPSALVKAPKRLNIPYRTCGGGRRLIRAAGMEGF